MSFHCSKCRKNTENVNPRVSKTSNGKRMLLSKCAICGSKILNSSALRTPLRKVVLLGNILF